MLLGSIITAILALFIGLVMFRIAPWYFTISSIAIAEIVYTIFLNWRTAGGAIGLFLPILNESWKYFTFSSKIPYYYIGLTFLLFSLLCFYLIDISKAGYYFKSIRDNADAASSLGVTVFSYKLLALALSAILSSFAGTLYAQFVMYIDPQSVLIMLISIQIVVIAAIGGIGELWGPTIGAVILLPLTEYTRIYFGGGGKAVDLILFSLLLLLIATLQPKGLIGLLRSKLYLLDENKLLE
jgi:branched-chain amino acid transport system permease protein